MKNILPIAGAALLCLASTGSAALADSMDQSTKQGQGQQMNSTGDLPEGSLANKRDGTIGQEPRSVQQDGSDDGQAEMTTPNSNLPEGSLLEKRQDTGVIGTDPQPLTQGGAGQTAK